MTVFGVPKWTFVYMTIGLYDTFVHPHGYHIIRGAL